MVKTAKNKKFYLALVIFALVGQVAWTVENMYLNVFIYKMFNASAQQISLMVAASAVTATVTTLLIGALSDKIGKRKVFICGGYIAWGISILGFALIREDWVHQLFFPAMTSSAAAISLCITLTIALDCLMTFFGSSANDAAFNAWLTDSTDETNRGAIEGINATFNILAKPEDQISAEDIAFITENQQIPEMFGTPETDPSFGENTILFRRQSNLTRVTLFEGGHDCLPGPGLAWLARQNRKKAPDWSIGKAAGSGSFELGQ